MVRRMLRARPELAATFLWEVEGRPVCLVCYSSPTPNSLRIAPVYTPAEFRRRGYASACTAAVCRRILDSGKSFVTLFADLANPTSNHVYQQIGFKAVCDVDVYYFGGR
jgi:predicted GNAT family acetyltransferase